MCMHADASASWLQPIVSGDLCSLMASLWSTLHCIHECAHSRSVYITSRKLVHILSHEGLYLTTRSISFLASTPGLGGRA